MGYWGIGPFDSDQIRNEIGGCCNVKELREKIIRLCDEHYTERCGISEPGYRAVSLILCSYGVTLACFKVNTIKEVQVVLKGRYQVDGDNVIINKDFDIYGNYELLIGKKVFIGEIGCSMLTCTLIKDRADILRLSLNKLAKEVKEPLDGWDDPEALRKNMFEVLKVGTALLNKINVKQSKTFEVIDIGRYNNKIVSYMLRDCTGKTSIVDANVLKENMIHNGVTLTNYTLTSDKRLVPKRKVM